VDLMTMIDLVRRLLFLAIFVVVPLLLVQGGRHPIASNPEPQKCPECGAPSL
jgi:hypothetical protein